jgi:broad specificity phosphatase PhoE
MRDVNIYLFRHGQADKNKPDSARTLTEEGKMQAVKMREKMGNPNFELGLFSPMPRTLETLKILAGGNITTFEVSELNCDLNDDDIVIKEFKKLGNASTKAYLEKSPAEVIEWLKQFGRDAADAIDLEIYQEGSRDVLVVGHAILLGFIILDLFPDVDTDKLVFEECEGIKLMFDSYGSCEMEMLKR